MTLAPKQYEPVDCILCGVRDTELVAQKGQFGWDTYVSICKRCGLVYLNPRWTKAGYNYFYATEYDQYYRYNEDEAAEKETRKAKVVWKRISQYAPQAYKSALDIGCGLGWLLHHVASQVEGLHIAGIEPSDSCAAHFTEKIGGELVARDVDTDWQVANQGRFDLVIFRHVLEHLLDPVAVLKKVRESMAPDGVLYIAVPDMMHPDGSLADFWFRNVHTYYFSQPTLKRVAELAGLTPVILMSESSELWGIFRRSETEAATANPAQYKEQIQAIRQYRRQRLLRRLMLALRLRRLSALVPKQVKNLIPRGLKERFRHLVYRH